MRYLLFDVFAERPFEGNQLAVFPLDALPDAATMQRLANELNLAESIFLTRTGDAGAPVSARIFTPGREIPFAGHPTVGATVAVADVLKWVPSDRTSFVLKESVGDVSVRVERADGATTAWLTSPPVIFLNPLPRESGAAMLQLDASAARDDLPVQIAGAGTPFLYVPLRDRESVDAAQFDGAQLARVLEDESRIAGVYLFAQEAGGTYSRMFAPMSGIAEDPATGSATVSLYPYLIEHGALPRADAEYTSVQGVKLGRRSVLRVRVRATTPLTCEVGGGAILMGSGEISAVGV